MSIAPHFTRLVRYCVLGCCLLPVAAHASHLEIAQLATQLNLASGQLAYELRASGRYSQLRQRAERLSRESADLVDAVRRERSDSRVRAQYDDVSRQFVSLEQAFLRLRQNDYSPYLVNELERIGSLNASLGNAVYPGTAYGPGFGPSGSAVYAPPVIIRQYQTWPGSGFGGRSTYAEPAPGHQPAHNRSDYYQRDYYQRDNYQGKHNRRDYGRRSVQRLPSYDHRSKVLDRQRLLDNRRPLVERERRGDLTETRRRNHYEQ